MAGMIQLIEFLVYVITKCRRGRKCIEETISCIESKGGAVPYITAVICYNEFRECLRRECGIWV